MTLSRLFGIVFLIGCLCLPVSASSQTSSSDAQDQQVSPDTQPDKHKESKLKRKLKEAAPDCIGISGGAGKCRHSNDAEEQDQQKREAEEQRLRDKCRDATDQGHPSDPACTELHHHQAAHDLQVGDDYFSDKRYPSAENRYRLALQEDPSNANAMLHLAQVLEKQHKNPEAYEQYERYLSTNPQDAEAEKARAAMQKLAPYRPAPPAR